MASAAYTKHLEGLSKAALDDFEYPTRQGHRDAIAKLEEAIEAAIDKWIEANCGF